MIGTRTPFRISFAGGGSDLPSFYTRHPGCVLSTSVDKYMYLFVHPYFNEKIQVKYSRTELVDRIDQIQHPIVRVALEQFGLHGIDINSIADVPAGAGLGSSSSFTVGLIHALCAYTGKMISKEALARRACEIELGFLGEPIGKQDQYAAAYGGLNLIRFEPDGHVEVQPVVMAQELRRRFTESLLMFYLGGSHTARTILDDQQMNVAQDRRKFASLVRMTELAGQLGQSLTRGNLDDVGPILDENWQLKRQLSRKISEDRIDAFYRTALANGASGGKLLGAGGGGFLLLYCEPEHQDKLRRSLAELPEMRFTLDGGGTQIIFYEANPDCWTHQQVYLEAAGDALRPSAASPRPLPAQGCPTCGTTNR
jgi:D-glycero-alpha-D-manno-heptose-7-phosphate kinase